MNKPYPKTINEFIAQYDDLVTVWVAKFGFRGSDLDDAKQDLYCEFVRRRVIEVFNPELIIQGDFLKYIKLKVNRVLCNLYNRDKRIKYNMVSLDEVNEDGEREEEKYSEIQTVNDSSEVYRWWGSNRFLLDDKKLYEPLAVKFLGDKAVIVTPLLILNMILFGIDSEGIIKSLNISRVCFNRCRTFIQDKIGPLVYNGLVEVQND